jgi:hypothetical protein
VKRFAWLALAISILTKGWAATLQVEIRDSEVWLIRDGRPKQLTHDRKLKSEAALSPSSDRLAYYEGCPEPENCTPAIVILDVAGQRVRSIQPKTDQGLCISILALSWAGPGNVAIECHINPSLSEYVEIDAATGRTTRDLLGYEFTRSPDGKRVAHVGWIVHFAPPYAKSHYLQVDDTTVYPLPAGRGPVKQEGLSAPPEVVRRRGLTYFGIHDFQSGLFWSPDSRHLALVDCLYDYTVKTESSQDSDGVESGRRCQLAIVALDGRVALHALDGVPGAGLEQPHVAWTDAHRLTIGFNGKETALDVK